MANLSRSVAVVFVLAGLFALVFGVVLCIRGVRGKRIGLTPRCVDCDFDLSGSLAVSDRCPECGLSRPGRSIIRVGTHRRRGWVIGVGALTVLIGIGTGTVGFAVTRAGFNPNHYKPVWLLLRESTTHPGTPTSLLALAELERRGSRGTLSSSQARIIVERVLKLQADPNAAWTPAFGDLFFDALAHDARPSEALRQYVRHIASPQVVQDPAYFANMPMPIDLRLSSVRMGSRDRWWLTATLDSARVNGEDVELNSAPPALSDLYAGRWIFGGRGGFSDRLPFAFWASCREGSNEVELTWTFQIMTGDASAAWALDVQAAAANGVKSSTELTRGWDSYGTEEWIFTWSGTFEVVPTREYQPVYPDDSLDHAVIDACLTEVFASAARSPEGASLWIGGEFNAPPIDLAYEVRLDTEEDSCVLGYISCVAGERNGFSIWSVQKALDSTVISLRFVPSLDYASRRQGMNLVDTHELRRPQVWVHWLRP